MSWNYNYDTNVNQKQVDDFMKKMATQVRLQKQEEAQNEARRAAQRSRVADATAMWKADKQIAQRKQAEQMMSRKSIAPTQYTYSGLTQGYGLKNPLTEKQYNDILNKQYNTYNTLDESELDNALSYFDDELSKPLDLSQFRIPRRRITRSPKSQYAKRKTAKRKTTKRKTTKRKTKSTASKKRNYKK